MSLHKKHIVLADGSAKPTASVKASVSFGRPQNAEADDRAEAKAAKKAEKSAAKQRYLQKKAKKKRKIDAAKRAAAPKNKPWKGDGIGRVEGIGLAKGAGANTTDNVGLDAQDITGEVEIEAGRRANALAGPSRPRPEGIGDAQMADAAIHGAIESGEEGIEQQVKRKKREGRKTRVESRTKRKFDEEPVSDPGQQVSLIPPDHIEGNREETTHPDEAAGRERRKREESEKRDRRGKKDYPAAADQASDELAISFETIHTPPGAGSVPDGVGEVLDDAAERERRQREKRDKRASRDKTRKEKTKKIEVHQDELEEVSDNRLDATNEPDDLGLVSPPKSPPPLEAFPLPRPAPAPDPRVLAQQGLPVGLTDATFVDQDLLVAVSELEWTRQGMKEKGMSERMAKRLSEIEVENFFAVQAAILPKLLPLRLVPNPYETLHDYLISAPTGSGKTLAYAIPLIEILSQRIVTRLRALVVLPTRELVIQVRETMEALAKGTGLTIGSVTGRHGFSHEQGQLVAKPETSLLGGSSKVDILIATPGRLMDHLAQTPNFTLQHLRFLVIDEADRLLNQSFQNWLSQVLLHVLPPAKPIELPLGARRLPWDSVAKAWQNRPWYEGSLPTPSPCQKLLFSATLTRDPQAIASLNLRSPQYFIVQPRTAATDAKFFGGSFALPTSLSERMLILPPALKPLNLIHLIHHSGYGVRGGLIFTKSVESASRLVRLLEYFEEAWLEERVVVRGYTSEMKPAERKRLLAEFAEGKVTLLVCSDLVARGMDLPAVIHVISYDVPLDMRKYVHRVGRTARAGRPGTAWTLVEKQEALHFKGLLKAGGREKMVRKVKVKEEELIPYRASYDIAMGRLKEFYGRDT